MASNAAPSFSVTGHAWIQHAAVVALLVAAAGVARAQAPITSGGVRAAPQLSIEQRLQRVEQQLGSQALLKLLQEVQGLRREVQTLRGENEVLAHKLEQMNQRMRELYVDLDQRLQRGGGSGTPAASVAAAPDSGSTAAAGTASGGDALQAQQAYQAAVDRLMAGEYSAAIGDFEAFLGQHADSEYAGNATYWLAETYYQEGRTDDALATYRQLIARHPQNAKASEAALKSAYILDEQGKRQEAVEALQQVLRDYPGSSVEPMARQRLADIQRR